MIIEFVLILYFEVSCNKWIIKMNWILIKYIWFLYIVKKYYNVNKYSYSVKVNIIGDEVF